MDGCIVFGENTDGFIYLAKDYELETQEKRKTETTQKKIICRGLGVFPQKYSNLLIYNRSLYYVNNRYCLDCGDAGGLFQR